MPIKFSRAYLEEIRFRYRNCTKKQKGKVLDEFCQVCDFTRKHAIRILKGQFGSHRKRPGPRSKYNRSDVIKALKDLWGFMNQMCSKKIKAALPDWLPFYEAPDEVKVLLLKMSASTIDRLTKAFRSPLQRGLSATRPGLIKNRIPLKLLDGDITMPGYTEIDTVVHCGNSLLGEYASSLTMTDLCSGWTENRAIWGKTGEVVMTQMKDIEDRLPFTLISVASDNGTEFLNEDVFSYLRNREAPVNFVRRRPYKKNDNAHVEQKNWTHVRQLFGYERFEEPRLIAMMNEIYRAFWNPLHNCFTPVLKLIKKERIGGRVKKKYDEPKTPYKRLLENTFVPAKEKLRLTDVYRTKNPIYLKKELDKKLKELFNLVDEIKRSKRLTGS